MSTRTEDNISDTWPHDKTYFTLFAKLNVFWERCSTCAPDIVTTSNHTFSELCAIMLEGCFQCYKKATHKGGALNKIIYVIVQSTFLTNNNKKKRLVTCTVFE